MKIKQAITLFFVLIFLQLFITCDSNKKSESKQSSISRDDFMQEIKIKGKEMDFDTIIYNPFQIILIDSLLIMNETHKLDFIFHIYNVRSMKKIGEFLRIGNGPYELLSPQIISSYNKNLWVFDIQKQKLFEYSLSNILNKEIIPLQTIKLNNYSTDPIIISSKMILCRRPFDKDKSFNLFDDKGDLQKVIGEYPDYLRLKGASDQEIIQGYKSKSIHNYKNRIVKAYYYTDIIDVYNTTGVLIKRITGSDNFQPNIKERKRGEITQVVPLKDSKVAYDFLKYAGDEFLVLYSGKLYSEDNGLHDQLLVFDWDGLLLKKYKLDIPIYDYTVDIKNRIIYGLTSTPEMRIIKYDY